MNTKALQTILRPVALLFTLLLTAAPLHAYDARIDGIYYDLDTSARTATVTNYSTGDYTGSVNIPSTVEYGNTTYVVSRIGGGAFEGCKKLVSVNIPASVTSIGDYAFSGCGKLVDVIIPDAISSIGNHAFYGCTKLNAVIIPSSVTSIGDYAFSDCERLEAVVIGSSVTSIGDYAFSSSVTSVGDYAYRSYTRVSNVTSLNPEPPACGENAFGYAYTKSCVLTVPAGSKEAYASAKGWSDFENIRETTADL
ncbi:MAG: leucine-rich repeat domain-containing protein [Prevotellaceae bacterium]|nr:leucine-rich repeat domain-containing protein [Prevotellaceae bacterium]